MTVKDITQKDECLKDSYFTEIFTANGQFIYNVIYRILGDHWEAEEVFQEVFIVVLKKIDTFREDSQLKTWLYRIAVNKTINHLKKKKRERKLFDRILSEKENKVEKDYIPYSVKREDQQQYIMKLMACLNSNQRACVVLRSIEGLCYEEIADVLEVKINTVKSRLKRAREKMVRYSREIKR